MVSTNAFEFVIPSEVKPDRVDKVLAAHFPEVSRSGVQRALDAGQITREGKELKRRDRVASGDCLRIEWVAEVDCSVKPVELPLEILYEDAELLVVNKPPGLITHPGHGTREPTLVHGLLHHTGGVLSAVGAPERPGIVHRLDKETSGVMVVAKTNRAHHALAAQFSGRETRKWYLAWVEGRPGAESGSINAPIGRHPVVRTKMRVAEGGREARTDWERLESAGASGPTLLRCRIYTGRTHQIRVHLQHLGHPILGDRTYGYKDRKRGWEPVPRVLLHAWRLVVTHPLSGKCLRWEAPIPEDFRDLETRLRSGA